MSELYIGLISGTSADGIDATLVDLKDTQPKLIASHYSEFTPALRQTILALAQPGHNEINRLGELDILLGKEFAKAANTLLTKNQTNPKEVRAIGSHGQTVRHHPALQFTLQIADPNIIATETGITTVADFRRRDMAHGGQGAPLVPAFHQTLFSSRTKNRIIVNIGGIANITLLPADSSQTIIGFDTGPGNNLLDSWIQAETSKHYDEMGAWAAQGTVHQPLLKNLLNDSYFFILPPKSTGPEYFNMTWLKKYLDESIRPIDVQATLVELTAQSITTAIKKYFTAGEILVCGGGTHNQYLMQRLQKIAKPFSVDTTQELGVNPDWVEAIAFAWLAKQTLEKKPGNIITVTGAKKPAILGGIWYASFV